MQLCRQREDCGFEVGLEVDKMGCDQGLGPWVRFEEGQH